MEDHRNSVLEWPYLHKEKSAEELTQSLWSTTMELEATRIRVQEEIRARDDQLNQLKDLLNDAIKERDEAHSKYQSLLLDNKLLLQQQFHHHRRYTHHQTTTPPPQSGVSSIEDEPITNCGFSSSDCEESIVSSPPIENPVQLRPPPQQELRFPVVQPKGLPEKGKFLEAMMKAGPLLQNLLLAGPLPHWQHPPPPLDTYHIPSPPLVISTPTSHHLSNQDFLRRITNNCGEFNTKRAFSEDCDSSSETKYQRIALN
ncbi:uncharacterized protein LOC111901455 [Lactuca sativa]|uniref:Uncharacterized protein n=1 Tax=Lactuca sativa TaxID=4236 RepID=A0A9R1WE58_LACSA|nr:uncharacterized protein LOC111901455 [Lactuca sativa]KAJ0222228.1 hypothetical protein LSAT_V11C200085900 [Lactuca sativa]